MKINETVDTGVRIAFFDIEVTNLDADFGYVICVSWKFLGEDKIHTVRIDDFNLFKREPWNDRELLREVRERLSVADIIVGWYSSKFDIPFLNSRMLHNGISPLPPIPHIDGWRVAKYKLKLHSNRLDSVTKFFRLDQKTPLDGDIWTKAKAGHRPSIKYIVEHCEQDVLVLEEAYHKIKSLISNHPNINIVNDLDARCPTCGSKRLQKRGYTIARTSKKQRYACQSCGSWSHGKAVKGTITVR